MYKAYHLADARESGGRRRTTHPIARIADVISGR
jgi:hypothetical protein